MMGAAAASWRSRLVAFSWQRVLSVLVGIALGLPLLLAGVKLRSAGISGFAETDYLWIETKEAFTTTDLRARNLRLAGLTSLELPDSGVLRGNGLELTIGDDDRGDNRTSIPAFEIEPGSQLTLEVNQAEKRLILTVEKELHFYVFPWPGAQVQIDGDDCPAQSCDFVFQGSRPFKATAGGNSLLEMYMDLEDAPMTFADRVAVSAIQLWEGEHPGDTVERRGAVKSGSFRLLEAPDQTVTLERGSVVDFEPTSLILRGLEVRGESAYLQLSGRVRKVSVHIGDSGNSLMPTWFDWLSRNRYVQVGVGLLTLLLGGGLPLLQSLAQRSSSASLSSEDAPSSGEPEASPSDETLPSHSHPRKIHPLDRSQLDIPHPGSRKQELDDSTSTGDRS